MAKTNIFEKKIRMEPDFWKCHHYVINHYGQTIKVDVIFRKCVTSNCFHHMTVKLEVSKKE